MNNPFIAGKNIYLRGLAAQDLPSLAKWMNDSVMTHYLFMGERPVHLKNLEEQWEKDIKNPNEAVFAIVDRKKERLLGWCGLYLINWVSRTAEYRIFIGEKADRGRGTGTEVAKLVIEYGFDKLNLNKIWLGVNADHLAAYRSYQKAGFVKEGVLRQEIYRNNRYYDAVRMSVLRREFEKSR